MVQEYIQLPRQKDSLEEEWNLLNNLFNEWVYEWQCMNDTQWLQPDVAKRAWEGLFYEAGLGGKVYG